MRSELSEEFDFTWVKTADESIRPERNAYGGKSMLVQYSPATWATEQPIHSRAEKRAVMDAIDRILIDQGNYWTMYPLNEPDGQITEDSLRKLYGGATPDEQVVWEHYAEISRDSSSSYDEAAPTASCSTRPSPTCRRTTPARSRSARRPSTARRARRWRAWSCSSSGASCSATTTARRSSRASPTVPAARRYGVLSLEPPLA